MMSGSTSAGDIEDAVRKSVNQGASNRRIDHREHERRPLDERGNLLKLSEKVEPE